MTKTHMTTLAALFGFAGLALSGGFFGDGARAATSSLTDANMTLDWTELEKDGPVPAPDDGEKPSGGECGVGTKREGDHCPGGTMVCAGCCCPNMVSECRGTTCKAKRKREAAPRKE